MKSPDKMSEPERRIRLTMLDQPLTDEQVSRAAGIKITTWGNIKRGARCSRALKRKITDFFGVRIWDDTPTELRLRKNVEFVFPTVKQALEFVEECEREMGPGAVFRRSPQCRTVGFLKEFVLVKEDADAPSVTNQTEQQSAKNREISSTSAE